jgi:predicted O-linked N-acetylglucosamine transferase (SPINDLY family)
MSESRSSVYPDVPTDIRKVVQEALALHRTGRIGDAEVLYQRVLAQDPDQFEALHFLGLVSAQRRDYEQARRLMARSLEIDGSVADAHSNYARVLNALELWGQALDACDRALSIDAYSLAALVSRGIALHRLGRHAEAAASYRQALSLRPDYAQAHNNLGTVLSDQGALDEASACFRRALELRPDLAEAHKNLGGLLHEQGKVDEAVLCYQRALELDPESTELKFAICMAQLAVLYDDEPEIDRRRNAYRRKLQELCDEIDREPDPRRFAKGVGSSQPFFLAYQGCGDRDLQALYGTRVCKIMAARYPAADLPRPPEEGEPVRVGIVSGYFHDHSNWKIPIKGWLSQLDHERFHLFGYHTGTRKDSETETAAALFDRFVQGPMSLDRWRDEILADSPHVLIYPEVGMDSVSAALAAQRLARVQCNSWGHPDTSGFPTLDYYISSDLMEPPGEEHYTERLVRLPNLSIYYEPTPPQPPPLARSELGIRPDATVFWCGQSLFKYLPQYDDVFPRIAREAGDCQFVFIEYHRGTYVTDLFRGRLERTFSAVRLKVSDYCVVLPRLDASRFKAAIGACDIVLDSIGWSGCNSTLESLPYHLPIVTTAGPLMRGRHTMAILKMMGVTDTIAQTTDEYISIAARLSREPRWRRIVRDRMAVSSDRVYRDWQCIEALQAFLDRAAREGVP